MAVIYFTSNATTGAGSLVEAIRNASPGDVIRPDETVFERGSTIEITLASQLTIGKNLTFDASPFRVRLVANGTFRLLGTASTVTTEIKCFDLIGGATNVGGGIYVGANSKLVLDACFIAGCDATTAAGGLFVSAGSTAILQNSAITGCRAPQGGGVSASGLVTVDGATIIGNAGNNGVDFYAPLSGGLTATNSIIGRVSSQASTAPSYTGSVVGVASSTVGFVMSPPDGLTPEDWNTSLWQDWDLRLFDDASLNPSPYRDSGNVDKMSQYDLQGNFRGRETNGVATCSPGAYETLQADLFWIGVDATGDTVETPSFLSADGWATSRFATASDNAAPQVGQKLFVGKEAVFVDTPAQGSSLNIGGYAVVSTGAGGTEPIVSAIGFGATFAISTPVILQRIGGFVEINWTSGNVTVNTDVAMSELSIPSSASITVNGAFVSIETLRVSDSSTVVFSGVDAILAATKTAAIGAATLTGTGYFATPPGTDTSSASFTETVRDCDYGANVSSFSASPNTATTAILSWVKQDLTPSVLIEEANGSAWNVVNNRATGDSLFVDISAPKTFRLFDGENFFTTSVRPYGTAYELAEEQTIGYLKTLISTGYLN